MLSQTSVFVRLVRDHMGKAPVTVPAAARCAEVVDHFRERGASVVIVADDAGYPAGIITEQDVCRRIALRIGGDVPVTEAMTTPVLTVEADEYLYHAIAEMRRHRLRHMPVVDAANRVVGVLNLHEALAATASQMIGQIDHLTHDESLEGMRATKAAQVRVASELLADTVPAPEIQRMLTRINRDLHRRIVDLCRREMAAAGRGEPPVDFDLVIMGSGGRGESYLFPDQDNGLVLADYPDAEHDRVDGWFIELAERVVEELSEVGFEPCRGHVMATNPMWRKTVSQWRQQIRGWIGKSEGQVLRLADIFFDFVPAHGTGQLAAGLRDHVTVIADKPFFLREMYKVDEEHGVALGWFGRLKTDPLEGPHKGQVNLKLTGTLPLVGAVRILALGARIPETSTIRRIAQLGAKGILSADEQDYLAGAFRHITNLLLRQQLADFEAGRPVGNHVPVEAMTERERDMLVDGFKAIRALRDRVRSDLAVVS